MAEDGSVVIKISGDDKPFRKTLGSLAKVSTAAIAGAGSALAGLGTYAVKVGSEFESSMSQVAATMGMTTEEIHNGSEAYETLATAAKNAGATTKFTATQAADALNYLALAGYDAATSAEVLPSVLNLAAAGGLELAYASDLATDAMAALGIEASADNLTQFGDQMAMASSKANYSVAQLGEAILTVGGVAKGLAGGTVELNTALGVLANRGIKGAEGGTALRNIIQSLTAPTDKAADAMKSLGVSAFDAEGNMRPLNEVFKDFNMSMEGMTQAEKKTVLSEIFNRQEMAAAENLLAGCGEEFDNLAEAIANSDGAMQNMADVQMDNLKGQITLLQSAVEGLGVAFYENVNGKIKDAVSATAGYVSELNAVMNAAFADTENEENVKKVTKALTELGYSADEAQAMVGTGMSGVVSSLGGILAQAMADIANAAPAMLDAGVQLIASFLQGIQENGDSLAAGALSIVGTLAEGIAELLPMVADTAASLAVSLADGLKESLPQMVPVAAEMLTSLVENLTENADTILQAGVEIIEALDKGLVNALPKLVKTVPQLLLKISEVLNENAAQIMDAAMQLMMHLTDGLVQAIPTLIETVPQIVINIANIINDNAPKLVDTALYLITRLATGLLAATPTILANIPKIIEAIVAAFMAFQWLNLGKQLIDGVANGVKKAGESMATAAKDAFSKFKAKITGSEVATELKNIGKYIIDGIVGGIKNSLKNIAAVAGKIKDTLLSKLKGLFRIASPSKLMKEEVGAYIGEGIAVGIEESGQMAVDAAETVANGIIDAFAGTETAVAYAKRTAQKVGDVLESELTKQNAALKEMQKQADAQQAAEELADHKKQLAEKNAELNKAKKKDRQKILKEIAEIEETWNRKQAKAEKAAEQEALQERISLLKQFQQKYEAALDTIERKQDSLQSKLADYGELFERVKTEEGKELFQLGDLKDDIKQLEKYGDALDKLKEKGISDSLMGEIAGMGVQDALDYMNKLISMSDTKFDQYVSLFEQKQQMAQGVAEKFYKGEFDALEKSYTGEIPAFLAGVKAEISDVGAEVSESMQAVSAEGVSEGIAEQQPLVAEQAKQLTETAKEEITGYQADFKAVGESLMEGVAKGVRDGQSGVVNAVAKALQAAVRAAKKEMDINSPSRVMAKIGDYMAQGIGVGWSDRMDSVSDTISGSLSDGFSRRMSDAYEKMRAAMNQNMVRLRGDIAVQRGGDTSYITKTVNHTEGNTVLQIEHFHNDSKEAVPSLMQEMEFSRRRRAIAKGGA